MRKRKVLKELEHEFRGKYASVSHASSTRRLAKYSPHVRESKKMRPEINQELSARRTSLFFSKSTTVENNGTPNLECYEMEKENIPVVNNVLQLPTAQANVKQDEIKLNFYVQKALTIISYRRNYLNSKAMHYSLFYI